MGVREEEGWARTETQALQYELNELAAGQCWSSVHLVLCEPDEPN